MSGLSKLKRFLRPDPEDAGCAQTFALLDVYVERELARGDAADVYPGVAKHLAVCRPCAADYDGLISLLS